MTLLVPARLGSTGLVVIIQLTSSTWWGFQSVQNSSQDLAQNMISGP